MLQNITIKNWMRVSFLNLDIRSPAVLFCGPNEAGKTSIAEAVRFVLMGSSPRIKLKKHYTQLVTKGAKKGYVDLTYDNNTVRRTISTASTTGDAETLPRDHEVMEVCLHSVRLALLDEKRIRALVMRLMGADMTVDAIAEKMRARGVDGNTIRRYRPLLLDGIKPGLEKARTALSEAKGAWQEVTGEKYGVVKAEDWSPDEPIFNTTELQETLAVIDAEVGTIIAAKDHDLAEIVQQIHDFQTQIDMGAGLTCPNCMALLSVQEGLLEIHEGPSDKRRKALEHLLSIQHMKRTDIAAAYEDKITGKNEEKVSLETQIGAAEGLTVKRSRAAELHQKAVEFTDLVDMLGEGGDGIQAEIVSEALGPLNTRLSELALEIGWPSVSLAGDMTITRTDGIPYHLLSESAQWRADAMIHVVISEMAEFPWLIFDRVDLLDMVGRAEFIRWMSQYAMVRAGEVSILAMATLKGRPTLDSLPGIQVHWIEDGQVEILEDAA